MGGNDENANAGQTEKFWTGMDLLAVLGGIAVPLLTLVMAAAVWHVLDAREVQRRALAASRIPPPVKLDPVAFARGQQLYTMACVACHGAEGQGVPGLGKDLVKSRFTRSLSNAKLAAFINAGRAADDPANTSKVPMPPKGGRMDFGDHNIADVVTYLRGLSDPRRAPAGPLPEVEVVIGDASAPSEAVAAAPPAPSAAPAEPEKTVAIAAPVAAAPAAGAPVVAAQAVAVDAQAVARGKKAYISCMACHGKDGKGVKNMGKPLADSPFVARLDDKTLADFIKKGRGPTDPENTTKIAMPPKGGNPALKDQQINDIVAYIRSLNGAAVAAASAAPAPSSPAPAPSSPAPAPVASASPAAASPPIAAAPVAAAPVVAAPVAAASVAPTPTKSLASASTGDPIVRGKKAYISCMACHGKDGTGVKNMGKDLVNSPFVASLDDQALVDFIKKGRGPTDPGNTTKIGMPPKGGNPALKDEQIKDIVTYIRSLRQAPSASAQ